MVEDLTPLLQQKGVVETALYYYNSQMFGYFLPFATFVLLTIVYIRTQDIAYPSLLALFLASAYYLAVPLEMQKFAYLLLAMGIAGILYRIIFK